MDISGMGFGMWVFLIIIILVTVPVVILLISSNTKQMSTTSDSPIEILKKRYDSGEIDNNEHENERKILEGEVICVPLSRGGSV